MFSLLIACICLSFSVIPCENKLTSAEEKKPSLHVLIATIGRSSLIQMLDSLEHQLMPWDYITVIFDGKDVDDIFEKAAEKLSNFVCTSTLFMEPTNLGYWGHGIRNKYNALLGDFILHADDDDAYMPGAFSTIRYEVGQNLNALYLFRIITKNHHIISGNPVELGHISTQNGVIPMAYNSQATWEYYYGGDFSFYKKLVQKVPKVIYSDTIIYKLYQKPTENTLTQSSNVS
jgi:hypothetical protein